MPIQTLRSALWGHTIYWAWQRQECQNDDSIHLRSVWRPSCSPTKEEYWGNVNPIGARGVYDEAKRFQEAITMAYHNFHKLDTRIVRIFNTYAQE
jgi:dTDP-glucose 4,6-dehydratase